MLGATLSRARVRLIEGHSITLQPRAYSSGLALLQPTPPTATTTATTSAATPLGPTTTTCHVLGYTLASQQYARYHKGPVQTPSSQLKSQVLDMVEAGDSLPAARLAIQHATEPLPSVAYIVLFRELGKRRVENWIRRLHERLKVDPCRPANTRVLNALISAYGQTGKRMLALSVLERDMKAAGVEPDATSFNSALSAVASAGDLRTAARVVRAMTQAGYEPDAYTFGALMQTHARAGDVEGALQLKERMQANGVRLPAASWNSLINLLGSKGEVDAALRVRVEMEASGVLPSLYTFVGLIRGAGKIGDAETVAQLVRELGELNLRPNRVTYNALLAAYAAPGIGDLNSVHRTKAEMLSAGITPDTYTYTTMISALGRAGAIDDVEAEWDEMVESGVRPNIIAYTARMDAHSRIGDASMVLNILREARENGLRPNSATFVVAAAAAGRSGDAAAMEEVDTLFRASSVRPSQNLYNALLDGWTRVGRPDLALEAYAAMQRDGVATNIKTAAAVDVAKQLVANPTASYDSVATSVASRLASERGGGSGSERVWLSRVRPADTSLNTVVKGVKREVEQRLGRAFVQFSPVAYRTCIDSISSVEGGVSGGGDARLNDDPARGSHSSGSASTTGTQQNYSHNATSGNSVLSGSGSSGGGGVSDLFVSVATDSGEYVHVHVAVEQGPFTKPRLVAVRGGLSASDLIEYFVTS